MSVLLSTGSVHHLHPEMGFWLAHMARFDGVELLIGRGVARAGLKEIARYQKQYQAPVRNIHVPFKRIEGWGDYWGHVRRTLGWAQGLQARLMVMHPYAPLWWIWRRRLFARRLEGLREAAGRQGVIVTLENLPRARDPIRRLMRRLATFRSVVALARQCRVRVTLDTTHLGTWNASVLAAFREAQDLIGNLHLSDHSRGRQHLLPKWGGLPLADLLALLREVHYGGDITLETCPEALKHGAPDEVLAALIKARQWIKRHAGQ